MSPKERDERIAWLLTIEGYKPVPVGNQPDSFLLGIMKKPIRDGEKPPLELSESMIFPDDYLPELE